MDTTPEEGFIFLLFSLSLVPNLDKGEGVKIIDSVGIWGYGWIFLKHTVNLGWESHCGLVMAAPYE